MRTHFYMKEESVWSVYAAWVHRVSCGHTFYIARIRVRYGTLKQLLKGCKKASRQSAADSDGCQVVEGHLPPWCGLMEPPRRCFSARRASTPSCARPYPRSLRWRHRDAGDLHPFGALAALAKGQVQKGLALVGRRVEGAGASLGEGIGLAGPL